MFFGYFLNIKKVTPSADFVIGPAKAGAFLFSHTRLPFPPRPLLPFGRISLRETGLAGHRPRLLGLPRKIARGISLRETTLCGCPLRGHGFATPHRYFAVPVTAAPRRGPNGKTPALFGYFLNTKKVTPSADSVIGPAKAGDFPLFPHAASVPAPALAPVRSHFICGETALAGYRPRLLGLPRKSGRGISLRETTLADVLACPVYRTENALFCFCRVFQYLTMQVKAPFY